jgi:transposase
MDTATDTPARRRGPKLPELALTDEERATLQRWARRAKSSQALALRCRIVLACAEGASNQAVAERLGISRPTVTKWRSRFVARRLEGLADEPRPGAARTITDEQVEQVLLMTLETTPKDATHWSTRSLAGATGMSQSAISRTWRAFGLKPHLVDTFKLSTDPQFIDKVRDIVGLYLNPPQAAMVLCVDEKSSIQALDRTAPILPLLPGTPQRATHDYVRHGTTNLYAALDVGSGKVISQLTARHRAIEFRRFLAQVERAVPAELELHVICDDSSTHKTPAIQRWLVAHPRVQLHFTPTYSSWLNLVERWFAELTTKWLRRGSHRSVQELEQSIRHWVATWNGVDPVSRTPRQLAARPSKGGSGWHASTRPSSAVTRWRWCAPATRPSPRSHGNWASTARRCGCGSPRTASTRATPRG